MTKQRHSVWVRRFWTLLIALVCLLVLLPIVGWIRYLLDWFGMGGSYAGQWF